MADISEAQAAALFAIGISEDHVERFLAGEEVTFSLPTQSDAGIGLLQRFGERIRCGIVAINDPGGGLLSLARFRSNSMQVAKAFGANEVELFGAAIINDELEMMLRRQSFSRQVVTCPDELGGGTMEILSKVFSVP